MHVIKAPIYQIQQIREFERLARERFDISNHAMMQRAGKAAFDFLLRRWPQARKIAFICGSGNNGGDGYVLALQTHERGLKPVIWQVGHPERTQADALNALTACQQANIPINQLDDKSDLEHPDLIVDAICGIGAHENMRADIIAAIEKIQHTHAPIFSLDVPTGIDADTGHVLGAAIRATATMTYIGLKLGLLTGSGIAYTGELAVNDLQLPSDLFTLVEPVAEKIQLSAYQYYLKPRARDWHKGLSGHVLVIGGEMGYAGAPRMAGEAALRVGAGLVSIATRLENAIVMSANCPELMCHGIANNQELQSLFTRAKVLVLGPGLSQTDWAKELWQSAITSGLPLVVDADGLNLLAQQGGYNEHWVLTPHPGEAARLLGVTTQEIQQDRLAATKAISKRYGGICVLKGAGSLVLAPNALPGLCDKGNPGMATGGMGDILSGVIAGLIAQGIPMGEAAKMGVCLHAMAGDLAAKEGERGMMAMDLMPYLRRLANYSNQ